MADHAHACSHRQRQVLLLCRDEPRSVRLRDRPCHGRRGRPCARPDAVCGCRGPQRVCRTPRAVSSSGSATSTRPRSVHQCSAAITCWRQSKARPGVQHRAGRSARFAQWRWSARPAARCCGAAVAHADPLRRVHEHAMRSTRQHGIASWALQLSPHTARCVRLQGGYCQLCDRRAECTTVRIRCEARARSGLHRAWRNCRRAEPAPSLLCEECFCMLRTAWTCS